MRPSPPRGRALAPPRWNKDTRWSESGSSPNRGAGVRGKRPGRADRRAGLPGFIMANAGVDRSNLEDGYAAEHVAVAGAERSGWPPRGRLHKPPRPAFRHRGSASFISDSWGARRGATARSVSRSASRGLPALLDMLRAAGSVGARLRVTGQIGFAGTILIASAESLRHGPGPTKEAGRVIAGRLGGCAPRRGRGADSSLQRGTCFGMSAKRKKAAAWRRRAGRAGLAAPSSRWGLSRIRARGGESHVVGNKGDDFEISGLFDLARFSRQRSL